MAATTDDMKSTTTQEVEFAQSDELAAAGLAIIEDEKTLSLGASTKLHWKILITCQSNCCPFTTSN